MVTATLFAIAFFVVGISHIVYTKRLAAFYRELYPDVGPFKLIFPFRSMMQGRYYEIYMRVGGLICVAVGSFLGVMVIRALVVR